jgi:hypothetical protein
VASRRTLGLRMRVSVVAAAILTLGVVAATGLIHVNTAPVRANSSQVPAPTNPHKINVLGEWAHPDDDTSIINEGYSAGRVEVQADYG